MSPDSERPDAATDRGGFCLGCGAFAPEVPASGACADCGQPMLRRAGRKRLELGRSAEVETRIQALPPEVQQASSDPNNIFATKYILLRRIGSGGMGFVWKAWELPLSRYVAIKFLKAPSGDDVVRFEREAQLAAALDHPNIIPVYEFGRSEGQYFLTMRFVDGRSLDGATLDERQLVDVMISVCRAVHSAHEAGVIHRDLKPANVMLTAEGRPIVLDFGLAKTVEGSIDVSVSGMVVGTPSYMPPEQAMGHKEIDRRSDVYSLGATLYTMAAGRPPFQADAPMEVLMKVIRDEPDAPRRHNPAVSPLLETIILKALEKDPDRRYATAADLADDLARLSSGQSILARPSRRRWIPRILRRNPLAAAAVLAVLLALAGLARSRAPDSARRIWRGQFLEASKGMEPGEPGNGVRMKALENLLTVAAETLGPEIEEVRQWFQQQSRSGTGEVRRLEELGRPAWPSKRADASQLKQWAAWMGARLDLLPEAFRAVRAEFLDLEQRADRIAAFPGFVTLRINVFPYARVDSMTVGAKPFIRGAKVVDPSFGASSDPELTSPLAILELELDDYELELLHPALGRRAFSVRKLELQAGRTFLLSGDMSPGKTLELQPIP
jgi:serine/threonine protein kinase